jgi:hypothetical protein
MRVVDQWHVTLLGQPVAEGQRCEVVGVDDVEIEIGGDPSGRASPPAKRHVSVLGKQQPADRAS